MYNGSRGLPAAAGNYKLKLIELPVTSSSYLKIASQDTLCSVRCLKFTPQDDVLSLCHLQRASGFPCRRTSLLLRECEQDDAHDQ